jgi:hypothetical protein
MNGTVVENGCTLLVVPTIAVKEAQHTSGRKQASGVTNTEGHSVSALAEVVCFFKLRKNSSSSREAHTQVQHSNIGPQTSFLASTG